MLSYTVSFTFNKLPQNINLQEKVQECGTNAFSTFHKMLQFSLLADKKNTLLKPNKNTTWILNVPIVTYRPSVSVIHILIQGLKNRI